MPTIDRDRARAMLAALLAEGVIGYALIAGLAVSFPHAARQTLATFGLIAPPPPPQPPRPSVAVHHDAAHAGKAAPAALKAQATDIVAPIAERAVPPPPVALAAHPGVGTAAAQGAAPVAGPGSGAGGVGEGTGNGDAGDGEGDGGTPPVLISGRILESDDPRDPDRADARRLVGLRFTVGVSGRVTDCTVTRTSGDALLDATTCALIVKRFRYRPARDDAGHPVPDTVTGDHLWQIVRPPPEPGDGKD